MKKIDPVTPGDRRLLTLLKREIDDPKTSAERREECRDFFSYIAEDYAHDWLLDDEPEVMAKIQAERLLRSDKIIAALDAADHPSR